ncbi:MAG TPA: hypothetical protein VGA32_04960, partial [Anaerolineales bacterium]
MRSSASADPSRPVASSPPDAVKRSSSAWLPWLAVVLGPTLVFGPMLIRGDVLYWGTPGLQFLPWHSFALQAMANGHVPLWNPWLGMGAPLLANHQSAVLYPPNLLLAVVGPAWGHGLLVLLHLIFAGAGMVVLARRLGLGTSGQAVSAIAFSLSGYLVARAGFLSMNAALAWVPWIVGAGLAVAQVATSPSPRAHRAAAVGLLSFFLAMQWLAGHAQTAWYTIVLAFAWLLASAHRAARGRGMARGAVAALIAVLFAAMLAAAQILPTLEYWRESQRAAGVDVEIAMTYSFWPWRLLGLLAPDLFGNPATGDYWGYGNYWEDAVYIGVFPFLFALASMRRAFRRSPDESAGWLRLSVVLAGAALFFALGKNTPVYPLLFRYVPTFDAFQAPARWNLITVFSLTVLAGFGADSWPALKGRGLYWTRLGTAGAVAALAVSLSAGLFLSGMEPSIPRAVARASFWVLLAGALSLARGRIGADASRVLLGAIVVADLAVAGSGLNPSLPRIILDRPSQLARLADGGHRVYMPAGLEYEIKFRQVLRFDRFSPPDDWITARDSGLPNALFLDRVASANNFDPLLPARYSAWIEWLEIQPTAAQEELLALMDVAWRAEAEPGTALRAEYVPVASPSRARIVPSVVCVDGSAAAGALLAAEGFDASRVVVLEGCLSEEAARAGGEGSAMIVSMDDPNAVVVEVDAPSGGWLLVSDTWYPGWEAQVDGAPSHLYRADYLFRAVYVPPQARQVEFRYR